MAYLSAITFQTFILFSRSSKQNGIRGKINDEGEKFRRKNITKNYIKWNYERQNTTGKFQMFYSFGLHNSKQGAYRNGGKQRRYSAMHMHRYSFKFTHPNAML
jgi:hypothetical protein